MNVDSIILSEYATLSDSFALTVLNTFNSIKAPSFPATRSVMSISLIIHGHRDERGSAHDLEIRVVDAGRTLDQVILEQVFEFADQEPEPGMPLRHLVVHTMLQTVFGAPGAYAFEVYIDGTYHAAAALHVGPAAD